MTGFSDSTAKIVVVSKEHGSMCAGSFPDYFTLAVQAIRTAVHDNEDIETLQYLIKEQHLDKFIKISSSFNLEALIREDDIRNRKDGY